MTLRKVTAVILCWNRWELTRRCLESLKRHTDLSALDVIVVDNGSTDGTPEKLGRFPWVKVVRNGENLGFVRGNNIGIAAADDRSDVLLLNNDVEFIHDGWLPALADAAHADPSVGVVGCRLVLPDGRLLHAGTYILPDTCWGQQIGALETDVGQFARTRDVQGIVFACAYLKRETLRAVGLLSEAYESYFEDTDYCLRARRLGLRTVVCGAVTLVHHEHGSTSDAPGTFREIFEKSRARFRAEWEGELSGGYSAALGWQSIMNFATGYAMSTRELLRALDDEGVHVRYAYVYGPGTPFPVEETPGSGDYRLDVIAGRGRDAWPRTGVVYGQGDVFEKNRSAYKVGYTMLEVDGFPGEWVRQANRMDEVWVPTAFNRDGFLDSGLRRPIHVMPLGVDVDHFHPGIRGIRNPSGDFVFLANFEWGERKFPELLLRTFNRTFRGSEPVVLLCKIINRHGGSSVRQQVASLGLKESGGRIAFIYNREFPYHQLGSLYRSADCYVSASRGEGWDMPLMEAMACGLPAIATDWGAHSEFVHPGNSYPLRIRGTIPAVSLCPYYDGFSWADPDGDHLGELLRHVFENQDAAREIGRRAALEMAARWTWRHAAGRIRTRLEEIGD